jgi:hypothetical protein
VERNNGNRASSRKRIECEQVRQEDKIISHQLFMLENEEEFRPDVRARKKINGEQRSSTSTFFCPLTLRQQQLCRRYTAIS